MTQTFHDLLDPPAKPLTLGELYGTPVIVDDPIVTNAAGGSQSQLAARFDLIPPVAITLVAEVIASGANRNGVENWRKIPVEDHLNHALAHLFSAVKFLLKHKKPAAREELSHAACRVLFALDLI